jgi:hypothetical protein
MLKAGTPIEMTKAYRGIKGVIVEKTGSDFELYILKLDNGLKLVAGPSAFTPLNKSSEKVARE